jgi:hypothetical protein
LERAEAKALVLFSAFLTPRIANKDKMFARKVYVDVLEPDGPRECPLEWLDSFCMRSFTGFSAFDDTLPIANGQLQAGFRVDLAALQGELESWLTRKYGEGRGVRLQVREEDASRRKLAILDSERTEGP